MGVAGTQPQGLDGRGLRIAIAMSRFNRPVVEAMCASAQTALTQAGVEAAHIEVFQVAGALELPLTLQWLAQTRRFDALIALGYNERESLNAVKNLGTNASVNDGIKQALKYLSKG